MEFGCIMGGAKISWYDIMLIVVSATHFISHLTTHKT